MIILAKTHNKWLCRSLFSGIAFALISIGVSAAPLSLSDSPLFLTTSVAPNVILTVDDSLSMQRGYAPESVDNLQAALDGPRFKAATYNGIYYNPKLIYVIPTRSDGVSYSTSFATAYFNGFDTTKGSVNLTSGYKVIAQSKPDDALSSCTGTISANNNDYNNCLITKHPGGSTSGLAAYYYLYYTQKTGASKPTGCDDNKDTDACYIKIVVGSTDDIATGLPADQKQNFANWYSFYRTRAMAVMSGAMNSVTGLANNSVRLGWQTLNGCDTFGTTCKGYDNTNRENRIRTLSATHKTNIYSWLQRFKLTGSTPLPAALKRVGDYFMTSGQNSPYGADPYATPAGTTELSCRRNYHVMFTDGLWNSGISSINNPDSSGTTTLPDSNSYTPQAPYKDVNTTTGLSSTYTNSNSLADVAFHYWATDLRTGIGMDNNITPYVVDQTGTVIDRYWNPKNDPATWQHMVNFTIGLGLSNSFNSACNYDPSSPVVADPNNPTPGCPLWGGGTFTGDYAALKAGTKNWPKINASPSPGHEPDGHVYDLWHAAINSRGKFFSADDPVGLSSAFKSIFSTIISTSSSSTSAAANSTSLQTGTVLYQAQFDSQNWAGHLYSFTVSSDGTVHDLNHDGKLDGNDANWDAATLMPTTSRNIRTINNGVGVEFVWNNLSVSQKTALKTSSAGVVDAVALGDTRGQDRLNWLRGDTSKEVRFAGGIFRNRVATVLGDIVNSDPVFTHSEDFGYKALPTSATEQSSYVTFVNGKSSRPPMVYDGANDGMLHAFRADTGNPNSGKELFAYLPAAVYGNLSALTETDYSHKFFVDGPPTISDAYLSGWKTVLVGGLGKGGKAIYALDISTPDAFTDANVLWEYSGSSTDTGATGTSDANGMGLAYSQPQIARLNDGSWAAIFGNGYNSTSEKAFLYIVNLSTGALIKKIPTNSTLSNGLSTPRLYDSNNDKIIDYVYAGDLQGNLWKFDLSSATGASAWGLGNGGNPLFTARNSSNQIQSITAQPTVGGHPSGGVLVYFGTGIYLANTDVSNTNVQSFYAIWDKPSATTTVARSSLVQQTITEEITAGTTKTISPCVDDPAIPGNECVVTFNYDIRGTSKNTVDYTSQLGWYMDLVPLNNSAAGERVISAALLKYDRIIFLTAIPSNNPCLPGGSSWLMEIDASTGGATSVSSFDFNNDDKFDGKDTLPSGNTGSGVKTTNGMVKATAWLDKEGSGVAFKEMSGTDSNIMTLKNKGEIVGVGKVNRLYWMQIQ